MFIAWLRSFQILDAFRLFVKLYVVFVLSAMALRFLLWAPSGSTEGNTRVTESFKGAPEPGAGTPGPTFKTAQETGLFLLHDADGYIRSMSKSDLEARKAICSEAYRLRGYEAARDFTEAQKERLRRLTQEADAFIERMPAVAYLDAARLRAIPWRLMFTTPDYEEGLPHTRDTFIFLSPTVLEDEDRSLVETLIHEKIHLYQRKYRLEKVRVDAFQKDLFLTDALVESLGFRKSKKRLEATCALRANPDLDDWIYTDPKSGQEMQMCYRSTTPTGILDVTGDPTMEHPFEWIAYEISKRYTSE